MTDNDPVILPDYTVSADAMRSVPPELGPPPQPYETGTLLAEAEALRAALVVAFRPINAALITILEGVNNALLTARRGTLRHRLSLRTCPHGDHQTTLPCPHCRAQL